MSAEPAPSRTDAPPDARDIPAALKSLFERYGASLLDEGSRLRSLLHDECPEAKREISVLMLALDEHVPQDLLRVHSGEPIQSLTPRLAKRLADEKAMSPDASRWAVSAWAHGLSVDEGLPGAGPLPASDLPDESGPGGLHRRTAVNDEWGDEVPAGPPVAPSPAPAPAPARRRWGWVLALVLLLAGGGAAGAWYGFLQPRIAVTEVSLAGTLVGDGSAQPVYVDFDARRARVRSVEVTEVGGDAKMEPATRTVPATEGQQPGRVQAGTLAFTSSQPQTATLQFVLVTEDGLRSAPFRKTFQVVPPVVLSRVVAPPRVRAGQPFAIQLSYQRGSSDIVRIERHTVEGDPWPKAEDVVQTRLTDAKGTVTYRADPIAQPMHSTVEFVLVDADGLRSAPQRVSFDVVPAPSRVVHRNVRESAGSALEGVIVAVREVRQRGQSTGAGAVVGGLLGGLLGSQVGGGNGRTAAAVAGAVGGALAGNTVEGNARASQYLEVTVRLGNGSIRRFHAAADSGWQRGQRVRIVGDQLARAG